MTNSRQDLVTSIRIKSNGQKNNRDCWSRRDISQENEFKVHTQTAFTCSMTTMETSKQGVKSV